jgi:hypothetical protein
VATYLVDFFQYQRIDSSTLVFDVHLAELVPVRGDGADFPDGVLVAQPVKEVVDPPRGGFSERVVWVDVDQLAVSTKVR